MLPRPTASDSDILPDTGRVDIHVSRGTLMDIDFEETRMISRVLTHCTERMI